MDMLRQLLDAVRDELGADTFTDHHARTLEMRFRQEYGRDRPYIRSAAEIERQQLRERVQRAPRDVSNSQLAEQLGVSRKHVWALRRNGA
jgi:hypothetical protein